MANLDIKNLSKNFGDSKILNDINLNVSNGEFIVLVGPSGSGKSTILRIIAGLEQPDTGEILIDNKIINNLHPKDRDIAMVFQNYALYPHMSVYENLAFPLRMKNKNNAQIQKAVNETAELLDIKKHLLKKPKELSGGERQRVALGRAIIRKPQLFLMDEPLSNLDAKLRTQMRAELLKLHKSLVTTVIYVTHDQIEALSMGNKIVVLNHGKVQQVGTPDEIYNNPINTFVASFIGSPGMNFFDIKFIDKTKINFLGEIKELKLKDQSLKTLCEKNIINDELLLGIRPENLKLSQLGDVCFSASVDLLEVLGNEYLVYATPINNKLSHFSIKISENINYGVGDRIDVSIDLSKVNYFDKTTGSKINSCKF